MKITEKDLRATASAALTEQRQEAENWQECPPRYHPTTAAEISVKVNDGICVLSQAQGRREQQQDHADYGKVIGGESLTPEEIGTALSTAVEQLGQEVQRLQRENKACRRSGSTLLASYVRYRAGRTEIYTASVGDSRAVCAEQVAENTCMTRLNVTHSLDNASERQRIIQYFLRDLSRQHQFKFTKTRINGLAMTRALGDYAHDKDKEIISFVPDVSLYRTTEPVLLIQASDGILAPKVCHEEQLIPLLDPDNLEPTARLIHQHAAGYSGDNRTLLLLKTDPTHPANHGIVSVVADGHGLSDWVANVIEISFRRYYLQRELIIADYLHLFHQWISDLKIEPEANADMIQKAEAIYDDYANRLRKLFMLTAGEHLVIWEKMTQSLVKQMPDIRCFVDESFANLAAFSDSLATTYRAIKRQVHVTKQLLPLDHWLREVGKYCSDDSKEYRDAAVTYQDYYQKLMALYERQSNLSESWIMDNGLLDHFKFLATPDRSIYLPFSAGLQQLTRRLHCFVLFESDWLREAQWEDRQYILRDILGQIIMSQLPDSVVEYFGCWLTKLVAYHSDNADSQTVWGHCCILLSALQEGLLMSDCAEPQKGLVELYAGKMILYSLACFNERFAQVIPDDESELWENPEAILSCLRQPSADVSELAEVIHRQHRALIEQRWLSPLQLVAGLRRLWGGWLTDCETVLQGLFADCSSGVELDEQNNELLRMTYANSVYGVGEANTAFRVYVCLFLLEWHQPELVEVMPAPGAIKEANAECILRRLRGFFKLNPNPNSRGVLSQVQALFANEHFLPNYAQHLFFQRNGDSASWGQYKTFFMQQTLCQAEKNGYKEEENAELEQFLSAVGWRASR